MDIGILALQGDVAEHGAALSEVGAVPRPVRRPEDLVGIEGIVLPGGESTTMSMLLDSSGLAEPLGKELAAGLPAFGTCAGMILLAAAVADGRADQRSYGAIDIAVRRNGFGRQLESFECDLTVAALAGGPLHAVFIRAPVVEVAGPGVEVLARLEGGVERHADRRVVDGDGADAESSRAPGPHGWPVLCRQGAVLVAAFHPELTKDRRVHELFVTMVGGGRTGGAGELVAARAPRGSDAPAGTEGEGR